MSKITRAVTIEDLQGLLARSRYATVAWQAAGEAAAAPCAFSFKGGRYRFGLPAGTLDAGAEVALVVDAGPFFFDLRGVRVRGAAALLDGEHDGGLAWFEVEPALEVAWHYGRMRDR